MYFHFVALKLRVTSCSIFGLSIGKSEHHSSRRESMEDVNGLFLGFSQQHNQSKPVFQFNFLPFHLHLSIILMTRL